MRQVVPSGDFPSNVQPIKFSPPEDMADEVQEAVGLMHLNPETGEGVALEFMLELSDKEVQVLKHEPYITFTVMADHLHPFAIQTSYPHDPKYDAMDEHTHICKSNVTHEESEFWKCENARHDHIKDKVRECESCWRERTDNKETEVDEGGVDPVV